MSCRHNNVLGMTWHQGPSQGPSVTASTTRGQAARMASAATTRGAACPRRVSVDKTRQDLIKMFLWAQQDTNMALLAVTCGLGSTGHESATIRLAWVSDDPAGLSQRRSGGLESAAGRQALSQRRAGGVISRKRRARELENQPAGLG